MSFDSSFWGEKDQGFEAITKWLKTIKQSNADFLAFIQQKVLLEDEYAKKLAKIDKSASISKSEFGATRNVLETFFLEMERTVQNHSRLASEMKEQIEIPLEQFVEMQKNERKQCKQLMKNSIKNRQTAEVLSLKAQEKYESRCRELDSLKSQKIALMGKDYEKNEQKIKKTSTLMDEANKEYHAAAHKAMQAYDQWVYDMKQALQKLQELEEVRLNQLKVNLMLLSNLNATFYGSANESFEVIRKSLESCVIPKDIELFIEQCGTGPSLPPRPIYKNHYENTASQIAENMKQGSIQVSSDSHKKDTITKKSKGPIVEEIWSAPDDSEEEKVPVQKTIVAGNFDDLLFEDKFGTE